MPGGSSESQDRTEAQPVALIFRAATSGKNAIAKLIAAELVGQLLQALEAHSAPDMQQRRTPYRVKEVAAGLGVSVSTVYRDIESGKLRALRVGGGKGALRIPVDAFEEYQARSTADAATKPADVWLSKANEGAA
jgi:excisionase family DNA binding protein